MSENFEVAAARYRPVFARIAPEAPRREQDRVLPHEQVIWLKEAGFGAARYPREEGGDGLTFAELFQLYIELAEADSNLAHAWRGHFEFVEVRRRHADPLVREFWRSRIVDHHEVVGNAWSERATSNGDSAREFRTVLTKRDDGTFVLNGAKHFSTGTIFADWVDVAAMLDGFPHSVAVPTSAPGVERFDDWDGFGQILTGTGTTTFTDVQVAERHIDSVGIRARSESVEFQVFQIVLLAVIVGIARRALREIKDYLFVRERPSFRGSRPPRYDELIQLDIGRLAAAIFGAEATVLRAAATLDDADGAPVGSDAAQRAVLHTSLAQVVVAPTLVEATSKILDAVGASATSANLGLDRHWRNARIIASHNPIRYRERAIGVFEFFGKFTTDEEGD